MSKSAPKAPDYAGAAQAQADSSREVTEQQTWANRPTINTPFGSQSWNVTPQWDQATGQYLNTWEQNTTLTPEAQQALDSQMQLQQGRSDLAAGLLGRVQEEYGEPMDWSQFTELAQAPQAGQYGQGLPGFGDTPEVPSYGGNLPGRGNIPQGADYNAIISGLPGRGQGPGQEQYNPEEIQRSLDTSGLQGVDPSQRYYSDAGNAIYNQFADRAEPQFGRDTEALRTQLYNQGLREGDEAYNREIERLRQSQGDARQQASYQATIGAGQEAARMHGMDLGTRGQQFGEQATGGAFANQAAQQALNQQLGIGGQRFGQGLQSANLADSQRAAALGERMGAAGQQFQEGAANAQMSDAQRAAALQEQLGIGGQQFQQQMAASGLQDQRRQQAGQEQLAFGQQGFNEQMQSSNYQNQLRQQQIAEQMQQRGFSLNEIQALLSGQQVGMPSMPSFSNAQRSEGVQALNAAQMQGQASLDAYNAQNQQMQGLMSGAMGGAMMFCDRRLKENIIRVGTGFLDLPIYQFNYVGDPQVTMGYMADEVQKIVPEAVSVSDSGYLMVNYERLTNSH